MRDAIMSTRETLLEVKDLSVCFHTPEGIVHAVNNASFKVFEGETLAVVGESGSGKSVSMMSILGLIPRPPGEITSGTARYKGIDLIGMSEKEVISYRGREIGLVFQDPMTSLNPVLTLGRQLTEALIKHFHVDKGEAHKKALEYLEFVGIPDPERRFGDYPYQLSGGMRQRVMIAMMLALKPSLLVADEPTTALDVTIQAQILELVKKLKRQFGMSIIWITHDLGVVAELAERVIVMYAGTVVEDACIDDLFKNPRHPYTLALLKAVPRMDRRREAEKLKAIRGTPPNNLFLPKGCAFAARCDYVLDQCRVSKPALESVADEHRAACWVDLETGKPRT
jgi:oligopeptide transport system ATP-binding protein